MNRWTRALFVAALMVGSGACGDGGAPTATAPPPTTQSTHLQTTTLPDPPASDVEAAEASMWNGELPIGASTAASPARNIPVRIVIESLGIDAAVTTAGTNEAGALDLPPDPAVAAWFAYGPSPGESGSAVLAAHVDYNGEKGAFYALRDIAAGAQIVVGFADGTTTAFVADRPAAHRPKTELAVAEVFRRGGAATITLVTCGGSFDRATRSYADNTIVTAVRASS